MLVHSCSRSGSYLYVLPFDPLNRSSDGHDEQPTITSIVCFVHTWNGQVSRSRFTYTPFSIGKGVGIPLLPMSYFVRLILNELRANRYSGVLRVYSPRFPLVDQTQPIRIVVSTTQLFRFFPCRYPMCNSQIIVYLPYTVNNTPLMYGFSLLVVPTALK